MDDLLLEHFRAALAACDDSRLRWITIAAIENADGPTAAVWNSLRDSIRMEFERRFRGGPPPEFELPPQITEHVLVGSALECFCRADDCARWPDAANVFTSAAALVGRQGLSAHNLATLPLPGSVN